MVSTKKYLVLRALQVGYGIVGWVGVIVSPVVFVGFIALGWPAPDLVGRVRDEVILASLPLAFASAFSTFVGGVTALAISQLIEVFSDIAVNTERAAKLLERALNTPSPAPKSNPPAE